MNNLSRLFLGLISLSIFSCGNKQTSTFEIASSSGKIETINRVDKNGLKQGLWIMPISKDTIIMLNDTGHSTKNSTSGEIIRHLKSFGNSKVQDIKKVEGHWIVPSPIDTTIK